MKQVLGTTGLILLGLFIVASGAWGALAITYTAGFLAEIIRYSIVIVFLLLSLVTLIAVFSRRWHIIKIYLGIFALLLAWFFSIEPSNERNWQTDVAVSPFVTQEGDMIRVHHVRNFDYRSENDYTPSYYDKTYDLRKLEGLDLVTVYWMGPAIAHVFLSFAFQGGEHLAISVEIRKEKGEDYSTLKGFFRQYELFYVVADERDVIRLRTNYRHSPDESVYIYRVAGSVQNTKKLLLEYINKINALKKSPEFYNTLTSNCTTSIWLNSRVNANYLPFNWKILVSGYAAEYLYDEGRLVTNGLSFAELQRQALVNKKAHAADLAENFSMLIRRRENAVTPVTP